MPNPLPIPTVAQGGLYYSSFSIPILTVAPRAPYHGVTATPYLHHHLSLLSKSLLHNLAADFLPTLLKRMSRHVVEHDVSAVIILNSYVTPLKHLTMYHGGGRVSY